MKPDAQIFINGHGEIKNGIPYLLIDKTTEEIAKTSAIMESVRRIPKSYSNEQNAPHGYTLHMMTCSSPVLAKEITPDKILWMRGTFFMYGDEVIIDSKDASPCVALSLEPEISVAYGPA